MPEVSVFLICVLGRLAAVFDDPCRTGSKIARRESAPPNILADASAPAGAAAVGSVGWRTRVFGVSESSPEKSRIFRNFAPGRAPRRAAPRVKRRHAEACGHPISRGECGGAVCGLVRGVPGDRQKSRKSEVGRPGAIFPGFLKTGLENRFATSRRDKPSYFNTWSVLRAFE